MKKFTTLALIFGATVAFGGPALAGGSLSNRSNVQGNVTNIHGSHNVVNNVNVARHGGCVPCAPVRGVQPCPPQVHQTPPACGPQTVQQIAGNGHQAARRTIVHRVPPRPVVACPPQRQIRFVPRQPATNSMYNGTNINGSFNRTDSRNTWIQY